MKVILHTIVLLLLLPAFVSCIDSEQLESRLEGLEDRVLALEDAVGAVNSNAAALAKIADRDLFVVAVEKDDYGYSLEFSDGTTVTVVDGVSVPVAVPLLSIDEQGNWMISFDDGTEYFPIEGASNAFAEDGVAPQVMVGRDGFWMLSLDSGKTWDHILSPDGSKMSADGATHVGGSSKFFSDVTYDAAKGVFSVTLKDGRTFSVKVLDSFYVKVNGYASGALFTPGQTRTYQVEVSGVESAFFKTPSGWKASLTDKVLTVTAPDVVEDGEYVIKLSYTSAEGYFRVMDLRFRIIQKLADWGCEIFNDFILTPVPPIILKKLIKNPSLEGFSWRDCSCRCLYTWL